jgi:hypothetical protein
MRTPDQWEKIPPGTNRQLDLEEEFVLLARWDEGLGWNPVRCRNQQGDEHHSSDW